MRNVLSLFICASFSVFSPALAYANGDDEPEKSMSLLANKENDPTGKARYVLIQNYYLDGNVEYALRAAEKLTALEPRDGKAFEMLGFVQLTSGRADEAVSSLKKAYALGNAESVILLSMGLIQKSEPIDDYLGDLMRLRPSNIGAYRPLLIHALNIESESERRKYAVALLVDANLRALCEKEDMFGLLNKLYQSIGDHDGLVGIISLKNEMKAEANVELEKRE